jgi:hypothetical protein
MTHSAAVVRVRQVSFDSTPGAYTRRHLGARLKDSRSMLTDMSVRTVSAPAQRVDVLSERLLQSLDVIRDVCNRAALQQGAHGWGWSCCRCEFSKWHNGHPISSLTGMTNVHKKRRSYGVVCLICGECVTKLVISSKEGARAVGRLVGQRLTSQ